MVKTVTLSARVHPATRQKLRELVKKGQKRTGQEEYNLGDLLTNVADYLKSDPYGDFFSTLRCRKKGVCTKSNE